MDWSKAAQEDLGTWSMVDLNRQGHGAVELRDLWNASDKDPEKFYLRDDVGTSYIYDLTAWHASGSVSPWIETVRQHALMHLKKDARVLDYGAGIGTYSLMFASMGMKVVACEVNPVLQRYIEYRAKKRALNVEIQSTPIGKFDMIVCLDTIEHLRRPADFLALAYNLLNPKGLLAVTWTFHQSGGMHPMHHNPDKEPQFVRDLETLFRWVDRSWPALLEVRL